MTFLNVIKKDFFGLTSLIGSKSTVLCQLCNNYPFVERIINRFYPHITAFHSTLEAHHVSDKQAIISITSQPRFDI